MKLINPEVTTPGTKIWIMGNILQYTMQWTFLFKNHQFFVQIARITGDVAFVGFFKLFSSLILMVF